MIRETNMAAAYVAGFLMGLRAAPVPRDTGVLNLIVWHLGYARGIVVLAERSDGKGWGR
jgi:hypothetical protein